MSSESGVPTSRLLSPLRLRLLGLVAVASFPASLLIARLAVDERRATNVRVRESAIRLLDSALVEEQELLRGGRQLLQALSRLPEVGNADPAACSRTLRLFVGAFPSYRDVERIAPTGRLECRSTVSDDTLSELARDEALAAAVRRTRTPNGYFKVGRGGTPQVALVEAVRDGSGAVRFYLAVDVDLSWLPRLATALPPYPGATATITNAEGFVYARFPDRQRLSGTRLVPNDAYRRMFADQHGVLEGTGLDSLRKLFVFRVLPSDNASPVLLSVGLPIQVVYDDADQNLKRNLLVAAVTLLLALMMAWIAADLFVIRDVRALLGATNRIATGDLTARVPTHSGGGELHELASTFNNMAEHLEERRREFLALGDASADAIVRVSRDLRVDWANDALLRRLGVTLESLAGMRVTEVRVDSSAVPLVIQHLKDTLSSGEHREVELHASAAGREGWVDLRFVPERDNTGQVTHVMLIARDISARKHLETHLAQAERLDSIGKLAGSISHDFNNLLTAIIGNTEIALRSLEPEHRVRADLTEILDVARRASALTRQLLSFARRQPTAPRVIDVKPFIEAASTLLRRLLGENITLELELDPLAPRIRFDATHFEQVLVNLATNGRDAMPTGGTLHIATSRVTIAPDGKRATDAAVPGDYLCLRVTDNGVGMSPAVRERIFEPFFTTKHDREGTGLGLAVTYGVVRQHGGFIEVESTEGSGTTFRVYFPATPDLSEARPAPAPGGPAPTGRETILFVEDQDPVRTAIARMLRSHGYSVLEARDGVDALRRLDEGAFASVDLLITDLVMPRMGGETLVRELRQLGMQVPVVLISGYDEKGSAYDMIERGEAAALLEKPFESTPLLRLVRELLDSAVKTPA